MTAEQAPSPEEKPNGPTGIRPDLGLVLLTPVLAELSGREVFGAGATLTARLDHCGARAGAVPQLFVVPRDRGQKKAGEAGAEQVTREIRSEKGGKDPALN